MYPFTTLITNTDIPWHEADEIKQLKGFAESTPNIYILCALATLYTTIPQIFC